MNPYRITVVSARAMSCVHSRRVTSNAPSYPGAGTPAPDACLRRAKLGACLEEIHSRWHPASIVLQTFSLPARTRNGCVLKTFEESPTAS